MPASGLDWLNSVS